MEDVFTSPKYAHAISLMARAPQEMQNSVISSGREVRASLQRFRASLADDVFNPAYFKDSKNDQNDDGTFGPNLNVTFPRFPCHQVWKDMINGPMPRLVNAVQQLIDWHFNTDTILGRQCGEQFVTSSIQSVLLPKDPNGKYQTIECEWRVADISQTVPPIFKTNPGCGANKYYNRRVVETDPVVMRTMKAAASLIAQGQLPYVNDPSMNNPTPGMEAIPGWGSTIVNFAQNTNGISQVLCLHYIYALQVEHNISFHQEVDRIFANIPLVTVVHANMKLWTRASEKATGAYEYLRMPNAPFHIKDGLRCSISCNDAIAMANAFNAFRSVHTPISVKIRLQEPTHDVLVLFRWYNLIVELQFHFSTILSLKTLSHTAYNISRIDPTFGSDIYCLRQIGAIWYPANETHRRQYGKQGVQVLIDKF